jgi:hypothetical protein
VSPSPCRGRCAFSGASARRAVLESAKIHCSSLVPKPATWRTSRPRRDSSLDASRCGTFFTMPRNDGVSGRSTTWLISAGPGPHHPLVLFRRADGAAHQLDLDCAFHHFPVSPPPGRAFPPRPFVAQLLQRHDGGLHHVVRIVLPIDLVSTLGMPQACDHRAHRPPAITPVPSGAGFSSTCRCRICPAPGAEWWFRARAPGAGSSWPLRCPCGWPTALPWPCRRRSRPRAAGSPITTSAEKLMFLPPLTTLVTRLMATTCSFRLRLPDRCV